MMGVSENKGFPLLGSYNKDSTLRYYIRLPYFGKPHMGKLGGTALWGFRFRFQVK